MNLNDIAKNFELKKFENAKKLSDYLKKKSPSVLKGYQKRYFLIADEGKQLVWFKNNDKAAKPKGSINIKNILEVKSEKKTEFSIIYPDRTFDLKADSLEQKETWINTLNYLRNYKHEEEEKESAKNLEISKESLDEVPSRKKQKSEWKNIDEGKLHLIIQEKEKILADETALTKTIDNRTVLNEKGIWQYLQYIKPDELVNNRLLTGFLNKRSKGKVKYFQRRWFVMVSAKPLWEDHQDEEILEENKLPPWMELDTLYYYKVYSGSSKKENKKGEIKMKECLEIIEKNMKKSKEKGYSFKINIGDKLFHINADSEAERKKWIDALKTSIITAKEKKKGIRKNIDNIVLVFDSGKTSAEKTKNIREKIDVDFIKLRGRIIPEKEQITSFEILSNLLDHMKIELMDIMNACLAKEPKRTDIIKEYIDYYHEKICIELTTFWDAYYDTMGNFNYLAITMWIYNYAEALKQFFDDERIRTGIKVLLKIYYARTLESSQQIIEGIVEYEKKNKMEMSEDNILVSSSPYDLFKILNEILELGYKLCPLKEMALRLAAIGKNLISFYQSRIEEVMDEEELETRRFVVFCNNTIKFSNLVKEYNEKLQKICNLKPEECDKNLDSQTLLKNFVTISSTAKTHVFYNLFSSLNQQFKIFFTKIDLEKIFKEFQNQKETISLLHESFSRKLWKNLLEKIVILYFQCFIISCSKVTTEDFDKFIEKMEDDKQFLINQFSGIVFENNIKTILNPFEEMMCLLEENNIFKFQSHFRNLRSVFGRAFTERAVKFILNLRIDLDKLAKTDIIDACKETLAVYNKENMEMSTIGLMNGIAHEFEEGIELDELGETEGNPNSGPQEIRRKSMKLEDLDMETIDEEKETESVHSKDQQESKEEVFNGEGYMLKKPKKKIKTRWEKRYFRIMNGVLYWYHNERSRESQNKINFGDVDDVLLHPKQNKKKQFLIRLENGKIYKFTVENPAMRNVWLKALKTELDKARNVTDHEEIAQYKVASGEGKNPLFKDYDEMRRKEKLAQALKAKMEKEQLKLKTKNDKIKKNKLIATRMETSLMNSPTLMSPYKTKAMSSSTVFEGKEHRKGFCEKMLECLGLGSRKTVSNDENITTMTSSINMQESKF